MAVLLAQGLVIRVTARGHYLELFVQAFNGMAKRERPLYLRLTQRHLYATATGVSTRVPDANVSFPCSESTVFDIRHLLILVSGTYN